MTFLLNPVSKKVAGKFKASKFNYERLVKAHIHHSVWGILILIIGLIIGNMIVAGIGSGIYLGHVAEEIYFNKRNVIKAFFILVTR